MAINGSWARLSLNNIESVPAAPGVYEIATLVRNTIFIGRSDGRDLRACLTRELTDPESPIRQRPLYFRYERTSAEARRHEELLDEYTRRHEGKLPPLNRRRSSKHEDAEEFEPSLAMPAALLRKAS